jgi:hypothetical protein
MGVGVHLDLWHIVGALIPLVRLSIHFVLRPFNKLIRNDLVGSELHSFALGF